MKYKVYIASPFHGKSNFEIRKNMDYTRLCIKEIKKTFALRAVALHGYLPDILNDDVEEEREMALRWERELLSSCDALFVCGDSITNDMIREIQIAIKNNIPILYFSLNCVKQLKTLRLDKYCTFYPTNSILAGYQLTGGVDRVKL